MEQGVGKFDLHIEGEEKKSCRITWNCGSSVYQTVVIQDFESTNLIKIWLTENLVKFTL